MGGSYGRREATGNGVYLVTERLLSKALITRLQTTAGARVVIQGFGNVGEVSAQNFFRNGAKVVAVSDSQGGIFHEDGLDPEKVLAFKNEHGSVVGMPHTKTITNQEILELECDILIPAALGNQIHADNAHRINAKLVVEAANNPTTPQADEILAERGIFLIPDIMANVGGVTVSYFEWVQNQANQQWDIDEVNARLQKRMYGVVDTVFDRWQRFVVGEEIPSHNENNKKERGQKPDFRSMALSLAIERIAEATLMRGIWP
jgi:glutamate dehydrogenase (NAD(P)+)